MSDSTLRIRLLTPQAAATANPATPEVEKESFLAQYGLHGLVRLCRQDEDRLEDDAEVFILQSVYRKIMDHLSSEQSRELGGLLLGREILQKGRKSLTFIQEALPARKIQAGATRLTFLPEAWAEFDREVDALNATGRQLQRVGWYHSHPRLEIFLSHWDLDVCREFNRPTQVALVVDPVGAKGGIFVCGSQGYRVHAPQGFWEVKDWSKESVVQWRDLVESQEQFTKEDLFRIIKWLQNKPSTESSLSRVDVPTEARSGDQLVRVAEPAQVPPVGAKISQSSTGFLKVAVVCALLLSLVSIILSLQAGRGDQEEQKLTEQAQQFNQIKSSITAIDERLRELEVRANESTKEKVVVATVPEKPAPASTPPLAQREDRTGRRVSEGLQPSRRPLILPAASTHLVPPPVENPTPKQVDKSAGEPPPPDPRSVPAPSRPLAGGTPPPPPPEKNPPTTPPEGAKLPEAEREQGNKPTVAPPPPGRGSAPDLRPTQTPPPELL